MMRRLKLSSNGHLVARNVSWAVIEKMTNLLSALSVGILVARYLGDEQYGLLNYIISYISLFTIFAVFGFDYIEIREESHSPEEKDVIIGTVFWIRLFLSAIALIALGISISITEDDPYTKMLLLIASMLIPLSAFTVIRNHFTAILLNEYVSKIGIFCVCVSCVIKLILMQVKADFVYFILVLVFSDVLMTLGFIFSYKVKIGKLCHWRFDLQKAKYLIAQSFPLMLSAAAATVFLRIDQVMIGQMIGNSQLGQFSVATRIVEILVFLPTIVVQTISPLLVKLKKENEPLYQKRKQTVLNLTVWMSILIACLTSLLAEYLVTIPFGKAYSGAVLPLRILAFKTIGVALNVVAVQLLIIEGYQKFFVLRSLSGCVLCIVLNYIIIPRYGIVGVSAIACITQLFAGWIIHLFIPMYQAMFKAQGLALLLGWKDLFFLRKYISRT